MTDFADVLENRVFTTPKILPPPAPDESIAEVVCALIARNVDHGLTPYFVPRMRWFSSFRLVSLGFEGDSHPPSFSELELSKVIKSDKITFFGHRIKPLLAALLGYESIFLRIKGKNANFGMSRKNYSYPTLLKGFFICSVNMKKPAGYKYALFPNFWEFLSLIASTLGVGLKEIKDNQKTFYNLGFLPISDNGGRNAVDILKHIVENAQKRKILGIFHKGPWKSALGIQEDKEKNYTDLAEKCIWDYRLQIIIYEPKQNFFLREYSQYMHQHHPDSLFPFNNQECENHFQDFLIYRENHRVRDICINIVCNFLGEEHRENCTRKYDELFHQTLFLPNDYYELLNKDLRDWDDQEKTIAFSIPFSAFQKDEKFRLYSEVLNRIASTPDRLAHNGSKHPNKWLDQYTELGHTFRWMMNKKIDDLSKQVLRKETCKRKIDFGQLEPLYSKLDSPEIMGSIKESFFPNSEEQKKELKERFSIKGVGLQLSNSLSKIFNFIPEDALAQIETTDISAELTRQIDEITSDSCPNSPGWIATSTLFPIFGATGFSCKENLQPYIPKIKNWVQNNPDVVKTILTETVSHLKDKRNIKNNPQESKK